MKIAIIRHGKPKPIFNTAVSAHDFSHWIAQYNATGISKSPAPTTELLEYARGCAVAVCSNLPRSVQSTHLLGIDKRMDPNGIFSEAGMPYADLHKVKLNPRYWAVLFRVLWYFGYSENSESYSQAKLRAVDAANLLEEAASTYQSVLFVGHGIFNRLIVKELKAMNWSGPRSPGSKYWAFSVYTK